MRFASIRLSFRSLSLFNKFIIFLRNAVIDLFCDEKIIIKGIIHDNLNCLFWLGYARLKLFYIKLLERNYLWKLTTLLDKKLFCFNWTRWYSASGIRFYGSHKIYDLIVGFWNIRSGTKFYWICNVKRTPNCALGYITLTKKINVLSEESVGNIF